MKKLSLLLLVIGIIFCQIPNTMTYQGKLTDTDGIGINDSYTIEFKLYNVLTGGTELWSETHTSVLIDKGLFTVELGSITELDLEFDDEYWLEITVDGDVMTPRQPLSSASYAFRAMIADSVDGGIIDDDWTITGDDIQLATTGNVGIGTAPGASSRLHVITNETPGEKAVFGEYSSGGVSGWLGSSLYGAYGEYDSYNYGALGTSGIGIFAAGETYAGRFEGDISVTNRFLDSGGDGGTTGQILSSTGAGTDWIDASGTGSSDLDFVLTTDIGDGDLDTVLVMEGKWGLFRDGNIGYGNACSTHVNLGVQCTTGTDGSDIKCAAVLSGLGNHVGENYSVICGGIYNASSGHGSNIGGGSSNEITGVNSVISGGQVNTIEGYLNVISGGYGNIITQNHSVISGGFENSISGNYSVISGGQDHSITGNFSVISGGVDHSITGYFGVISGGVDHSITGDYGAISGGQDHSIIGDHSVVSGGFFNTIEGDNSAINGGYMNDVVGSYSSIPGGFSNNVNGDYSLAFGHNVNVSENNYTKFYSNAHPGTFRICGELNVNGIAFVTDLPEDAAPDSIITVVDGQLSKSPIDAINDRDMIISTDIGDGDLDTVLVMEGKWGLFRNGNVGYGNACSTHVNLGVQCTTGADGDNDKYAAVLSGLGNRVSANKSSIGGGEKNVVSDHHSFIGGGERNTISDNHSIIGGGLENILDSYCGAVLSGHQNEVYSDASVVCGGEDNIIESDIASFIGGGGDNNIINGFCSSILCGHENNLEGEYSTIPGGYRNTVNGDYSMAFGRNVNVSEDYYTKFYSNINPGTLKISGELNVNGIAFVTDLPEDVSPDSVITVVDGQLSKSPIDAINDRDMIISTDIGDGDLDTVLVMEGKWGLFRAGNIGYGNACSTHVNLGVQCTTGINGANNNYVTVLGGLGNHAGGGKSVICGGENNIIDNHHSFIGGGNGNTVNGFRSAIICGLNNTIESDASIICGGINNSIGTDDGCFIGGGYDHLISSGIAVTISGGQGNNVEGDAAVISGGWNNEIIDGLTSTIGGGRANSITGNKNVISGGRDNTIDGQSSAIPGGCNNNVTGDYSFAFGNSVTVASDYTTSLYSEAYPGTFNIAGEVFIQNYSDIDSSNALLNIRNSCNDEGAYTGIRFKSHDNDAEENYKGGIFFDRTASFGRGDMLFALNNSQSVNNVNLDNYKMVITHDGNVGIDVREPGWLLEVNGNAAKPGGGSWTSSCDRRLKDIHADFDKGIDELLTLQPKYYNYKQDNPLGLPSDQTYIGLIAQDVQAVIPEAVSTNDKSDFLYLNNDAVIMAMLNAIKDQQGQIEELRKENEELREMVGKIIND